MCTASRARLIQNGNKSMPPPLRNDDHPNGLPWLTKDQQERVNKANELYHITCKLILLCQEHHILRPCENPGRSFMWPTTPFKKLFSTIECMSTEMHHCVFGSSRRKPTRVIHNIQSFLAGRILAGLGLQQNKRHIHGPLPEPLLHRL